MIEIENVEVIGWEAAIRGMRNPLNSWDKSDSKWDRSSSFSPYTYRVGPNDLELMRRLARAGSDHAKYRRMITVYADVTGPLYWWKEYDTYKVGTVANSCSTMHKIQANPIDIDDFSIDYVNLAQDNGDWFGVTIANYLDLLEDLRQIYNNENNKEAWRLLIQLLPSSYNQKRTVQLNYEVLANMYKSRRNHKLDEWRQFCSFINLLPYSELITLEES